MKYILMSLCALLFLSGSAMAQDLPPKGEDESYVIVPGGACTNGLAEIGMYKPELDEIWSRSPREFVEICEPFIMKTFIARYRLAVRCVERETKHPRGTWTRSQSGLNKPWPEGCPGFLPGQPVVDPQTTE